jgi:FkbM family methyltransferase
MKFFYKVISKVVYLVVPIFTKLLILMNLNSRVINQLNRLRFNSNNNSNYTEIVSQLLNKYKLTALDVGAQGGFNGDIFPKRYNNFFKPIMVEPLKDESNILINENYKVIQKGLWSSNCKRTLHVLKDRTGSSSFYMPDENTFDLYDIKKKNYPLFNVSNIIEIDCTTIKDSLNNLDVKYLDFLKIDTQGSELEILKGLGEYIPLAIKLEVQIIPMYKNVPNWGELINYLYKLNYMTCEWSEIGNHATRSPAEMDMLLIPNFLTDAGKKLILSREKEFVSLMIILGQIKLLKLISKKLNFSSNSLTNNLKDKFFQ